jgi:hypothetical protein
LPPISSIIDAPKFDSSAFDDARYHDPRDFSFLRGSGAYSIDEILAHSFDARKTEAMASQ